MRNPVLLSSVFAFVLGSAAATAQERPATAPAPTASMPMDCAAGSTKRHDHGAERNAPGTTAVACVPKPAVSEPKTKAKPAHDHAKFHKNQ